MSLQTSCRELRLQPGSLEPLTPTKRGRGRPPGPKSYSKHSDLLSKIKKAATRLAVVPASFKLLSKSPSPRAPSRLMSKSPPRGPRAHTLPQALTPGGLEARNAGDAQSRQAEEQRSLFALTKRSPLRTASRTSSASASSSRSPGRLVINSAESGDSASAPLTGSVADSASTAPSTPAPDLFPALPPLPPPPQPQNTLFRKAAPVAIGGQFLSPGTFIVTTTAHLGPRMRFPVVSASASALSLTSSPAALHPLPTAIRLQRGPITAIVTPTTIFTPLSVRGMLPMPMTMHAVQNVGGSVQTVQLVPPPNMLPVLHVRSPTPLPVICTISPPRAPALNLQSPATMQMQMQSGIPFSLSSAPTPLNFSLSLTQAQAPMLPLSLSSAPAPTPQFSVISANPFSLVPIQFTTNAGAVVQRPPTTFFTAAPSSLFPTPLTAAPSLASVPAAAAPIATPTVAHPPAASAGAGVGDRSFSSELSALFSNVVAGIGLPTNSTGAAGALGAPPRNPAAVSVAAAQSSAAPVAAPVEIDLSLPISFTSLSAPAGAQQTQQR